MLAIGATIVLTIRLTNYYIWIGSSLDVWGPGFYVHKFWSKNWWEGDLFENSNDNMLINGYIVTTIPVIVKTLDKKDITKVRNSFIKMLVGEFKKYQCFF